MTTLACVARPRPAEGLQPSDDGHASRAALFRDAGDHVYFFMDFSLIWMPAIVLGLTLTVLTVHGVVCILSACKRRWLMDTERASRLFEPKEASDAAEPVAEARYSLWKDKQQGGEEPSLVAGLLTGLRR